MRMTAAVVAAAGIAFGSGAALAENSVSDQRERLAALWGKPAAVIASQTQVGQPATPRVAEPVSSDPLTANFHFGRRHEPAGH